MALRNFKCIKCDLIDLYFDHEDKTCKDCQGKLFQEQISLPSEAKHTECLDKYHNVNAEKNVQADSRARSQRHVQDTLSDMIEEHGEKIAKEQGWLRWDAQKKIWRKRDNWDIGLLGKENSGSPEILRKQEKAMEKRKK